ncbi:MAG: rhomboid family intramembrane serine protease [Desulfocapsaceae bacterium]|jgi:membrane associated rhomboid family serine protease|nr:rhomboid family intramembrane serine protease [Desulfocapsaceae bacterium]
MESSSIGTDGESVVILSRHHGFISSCSLVLSAKNIGHRIRENTDGTIHIICPAQTVERARHQLNLYLEENRNWPPPKIAVQHSRFPALLPTLALVGSLIFLFMITGPWRPGALWFEAGANDAEAILDGGQWYRLITSLTLHADFSHLAGNCLIGGVLLYFFLQINGAGFGLLAVLLSGTVGNLVNVLAHGGDHLSVGFSTAVFGIIGMLSMYQMIEQRQPFGIRLFVPFMAGAALLAMLGSSGERTDLGSHLFGLLSGLVIGLLIACKPLNRLRQTAFMQILFFIIAIAALIFSWNSALSSKMS